jgi:hypothetical protein
VDLLVRFPGDPEQPIHRIAKRTGGLRELFSLVMNHSKTLISTVANLHGICGSWSKDRRKRIPATITPLAFSGPLRCRLMSNQRNRVG